MHHIYTVWYVAPLCPFSSRPHLDQGARVLGAAFAQRPCERRLAELCLHPCRAVSSPLPLGFTSVASYIADTEQLLLGTFFGCRGELSLLAWPSIMVRSFCRHFSFKGNAGAAVPLSPPHIPQHLADALAHPPPPPPPPPYSFPHCMCLTLFYFPFYIFFPFSVLWSRISPSAGRGRARAGPRQPKAFPRIPGRLPGCGAAEVGDGIPWPPDIHRRLLQRAAG